MKKLLTILLIFLLTVNLTAGVIGASEFKANAKVQENEELSRKLYRAYNPKNGEHLYTPDGNEVFRLQKSGWIAEGLAWYTPLNGEPVYRLYNPRLQNHLYTKDPNEVNILTSQLGWTADNNGQPLFFSGGNVNVYRLHNPGNRGLHHLTTDENEYNVIPAQGWQQEGVSLNAVKMAGAFPTQEQAFEDIKLLMQEYPLGTPWSFDDWYDSVPLGTGGDACHAFALMSSDRIFGYLPGRQHTDINNIKIGDIVRYHDSLTEPYKHTCIVMGVNGTKITVAEGNWGKKVNYYREQELNSPDVELFYIWTRYP